MVQRGFGHQNLKFTMIYSEQTINIELILLYQVPKFNFFIFLGYPVLIYLYSDTQQYF